MAVKPVLSVLAFFWLSGAGWAACPVAGTELPLVRIEALDAHGDPRLADGRTLRLIGLAPRLDAAARMRLETALAPWLGRDVGLLAVGGTDRWGRQPARLFAPAPDEPAGADLATALLRTGAATRLAEAAFQPCTAPSTPTATPTATPFAMPSAVAKRPMPPKVPPPSNEVVLDGHDVAALRGHAGRYVVLQGTIASVGERTRRTYLNFSRRRGEAAAISLSRGLWRVMQEQGWSAATLVGKTLRARGILAGQDGMLLDVTTANALELID